MQRISRTLKRASASAVLILVVSTGSLAWPDFKTIDTDQLHAMVVDNAYLMEGGRARRFTVIDARTKEEYDEAHIFSAVSIPKDDFEKSMNRLPQDKGLPLVVYCNGDDFETCGKWVGKASSAGYTNVSIYSEGFAEWKEKKMPAVPF